MSPMEYYYRHKEDDSLISDLHNKEYSNIYDLIEFVEGSSSLETYILTSNKIWHSTI